MRSKSVGRIAEAAEQTAKILEDDARISGDKDSWDAALLAGEAARHLRDVEVLVRRSGGALCLACGMSALDCQRRFRRSDPYKWCCERCHEGGAARLHQNPTKVESDNG